MNSWIRSQKEEKIYIAVMNGQEWADTKECRNNLCVRPFSPSLRYCRMERKRDRLRIQMETPSRKSETKEFYYSIWIAGNLFVIVGEDDFLVWHTNNQSDIRSFFAGKRYYDPGE